MKSKLIIPFIILSLTVLSEDNTLSYDSYQGCCSGHGGISYDRTFKPYCMNGRVVCKDGTTSIECICSDNNIINSYSYQTPIPKFDLIRYSFRVLNKFDDWEVIQITSHGNELAIRTENLNSSYTEQFSNIQRYNGGTIKSRNGKEYYINYELRLDVWKYKDNNLKLFYDFNKSNNFTPAIITYLDYLGNIAIIHFQPQNVPQYYNDCRKYHVISFKIVTPKGEEITDFSLSGFTNANNMAYNKLR